MSFLRELTAQKSRLKPAETVVTLPDGRRFVQLQESTQELSRTHGFIVDTKPDNVPAKILENLYLGSQDCCEEAVLEKYHIGSVLSVGVEPSCKFGTITYKFVECLDLPESDIGGVLEASRPFIKDNLDRGRSVLVHCNAGVSRSSAVVIGYLVLELAMGYSQAFGVVKVARACVRPNAGFERQLRLLSPEPST